MKTELNTDGKLDQLAFQNFVIFLLISPYENEKVDMLHIMEKDYPRELEKNDHLARFVHKLLTFELMPLNEREIEQTMSVYQPFAEETENSKSHMRELIKQLI